MRYRYLAATAIWAKQHNNAATIRSEANKARMVVAIVVVIVVVVIVVVVVIAVVVMMVTIVKWQH